MLAPRSTLSIGGRLTAPESMRSLEFLFMPCLKQDGFIAIEADLVICDDRHGGNVREWNCSWDTAEFRSSLYDSIQSVDISDI
jgi:hypothetical protein